MLADRYRVIRPLGRGGLARALLAHDEVWERDVVIKLVTAGDPASREALRREFALLRSLEHPRLAPVHDFAFAEAGPDGAGPVCFYTTDFVDGLSLDGHVEGRRWGEATLQPLLDALEALRVLHAAGVRHGDVKPENILVGRDGRGVLIDLSCAAPIGAPASASGTPGFLAPELFAGRAVDHRADLYALGVTLDRLIPRLAEPPPAPVAELIRRLLRPDPRGRPADVAEVLEHLGVETAAIHPVVAILARVVGRDRELAAAAAAIDDFAAGRPGPRVLHISGPPGVGRTTVLREVAWLSQQRCRVLEIDSSSPAGLSPLFERTAPEPSPPVAGRSPTVADVLALREELAAREDAAPVVWLIDDAHLLEQSQRAVLDALLRTARDRDPLLIVSAGPEPVSAEAAAVVDLALGPLAARELDRWLGAALPPAARRRLFEVTGGHPAAIRYLLAALSSGQLREEELEAGLDASGLAAGGPSRLLDDLDDGPRRAAGLLALLGRRVSGAELTGLAIDVSDLRHLAARGLVAADGAGWKIAHEGLRQGLVASLSPKTRAELLQVAAGWCAERAGRLEPGAAPRSAAYAEQARLLLWAGRREEALQCFHDHAGDHALAPSDWQRVARPLAEAPDAAPRTRLHAAAIARATGRSTDAAAWLEALLEGPVDADVERAARVELGICRLRLGEHGRALEHLRAVLEDPEDDTHRARAAVWLVRALTSARRHDEAVAVAREELARATGDDQRAALQEALGLASWTAGDLDEAAACLDAAVALGGERDDPRRAVRLLGARALIAFARGRHEAAAADQRRSLELAEAHGLVDQVATAALNLGTISHAMGRWAEALSAYERGLRTAVAAGQAATEAHLRFDLASLSAELGMTERAERLAGRCVEVATAAGLPQLVAAARTILAEVDAARGDAGAARARLLDAREALADVGSPRELAELDVQLAEVECDLGEVRAAVRRLEACEAALDRRGAEDVAVRLALARARCESALGEHDEAARRVDEALEGARALGLGALEARGEALRAELWSQQGAPALAEKHRRRAVERWEACLAGLPEAHREAFWAHPARASLRATEPATSRRDGGRALREYKYKLLLDINTRLAAALDTKEILDRAIDAAIELTSAERGFVLLVDRRRRDASQGLRVAAARNLDREELGRSHMKFSQGIAARVIEERAPLITADAEADGRFAEGTSIHAMRLKSVVCVPVRSAEGVLGALYLDNRFQRGLFGDDDVELLLALADQVAIALVNARLHDELRRRNRALEAERRRVEELARGQAEEIERLTEQVERQRRPAEPRRLDRGEIVGASRAMEDVFAVLERVVDTDLPVLIQGASGTGKELLARAVHRSSPRRDGPLVSINCGALPESLLESELFGYERGAFTGADRPREGLIVQAGGGTLFLDEVGEMPAAMQVKLLRVLQEREVQPLGSGAVVPVDFRLVCATNRVLRDEVEAGRFREDLFYRIGTVEVTLPPLAERDEDIPRLVAHFLPKIAASLGRPAPVITRQAVRKLMGFTWPGNVRQLEHVLTKAVVLAEGDRVAAADIDLPAPRAPARASRAAYEQAELERIVAALEVHRWNISKVSRELGIPRPTLYRRLEKHGLTRR